MPSRRSTKLRMYVDTEGKQLVADGSDFIVVAVSYTHLDVYKRQELSQYTTQHNCG